MWEAIRKSWFQDLEKDKTFQQNKDSEEKSKVTESAVLRN